ncbi:hypothetical protein D0Z07_1327 [Hyphodiscus hymeniophilus]|uniref:Uncharacterized protein n=1 Tax=Hyphodiscus hymeniophilus TaxID=353542 RepID=A0A9P6VRC4_9HELO|nr:hypothetical protein D0Z07_1327 [Hyphodiscus hymeniophilus]
MSWDQAYSFGNPNAQPPTPTQTPTSAQFPSPTFQTPRNNPSSFEDRSGWTPTFAEEYSVFNSTPGRLTSNQHHFVEASTPRLRNISPLDTRPSNVEHIASELASHVHHLSPNPAFPLPPVEQSDQLPSSPDPYSSVRGRLDDSAKKRVTPRKPKKRLEEAFSGQTATPPQSASKGSRRLAPKVTTGTMQNDYQNSQYGIDESPTHHHNILQFSTSATDLFGYPMSAPASAPVFTNTKPFWDPDASMAMDLDFGADTASMPTAGSHRVSNSFDWGRSNQIFQDTVNMPSNHPTPQTHPTQPVGKRQRPLAPKLSAPATPEIPTTQASFDFYNTNPTWQEPFSATSIGGVDPVLLFSRNITATMPSEFEDVVLPGTRPSTSHAIREPYQHQTREAKEQHDALRRVRSSRESSSSRRFERGTVSSPVKGSARPGLQRSASDSRGRRPERMMQRTGRTSPVKRLQAPNLTPISEAPLPKARTEVRLMVDKKGRARTETILVDETKSAGPTRSIEGYGSSQSESSTDEDDIIIPSRNTSFAGPPQTKGPKLGRFETSNRDLRRHSTSASNSYSETSSQQSLMDGVESEAETVMEEDDGSGDATRALRKVMENRKKEQMKQRNPRHHRYSSDPRGSQYMGYASSSNLSPTTVTDPEGATPSSTRSGTTRLNLATIGFTLNVSILIAEAFLQSTYAHSVPKHPTCEEVESETL